MSLFTFNSQAFSTRLIRRVGSKVATIVFCAAAFTSTAHAAETVQVDVLSADIARLKKEIGEKEQALAKIVNAKITEPSVVQQSVASSFFSRGLTKSVPAPTSSLARGTALQAAYGSNLFVKGSVIKSVAATGSMEPVLSEHSYLLLEPARFEDLKVGDIVTYIHPAVSQPVTHRLIGKRGDAFIAKGDHNTDSDNVWVTKENYQMRVYGIIYSHDQTS